VPAGLGDLAQAAGICDPMRFEPIGTQYAIPSDRRRKRTIDESTASRLVRLSGEPVISQKLEHEGAVRATSVPESGRAGCRASSLRSRSSRSCHLVKT
jgi:hypothetical protein